MKVKKLLLGFGILALASTFLVACSQQESQKVTTIEVFSQKPETKDVLQSIINDFEKDNKDIKVKFTNVPNPGEMLKSRVFVNKTPDIVHLFPINTEFKMWAKKGLFEDLSNESFMKRLKPGTADSYAIDGKEYTIPLNVNGYGFFYNATKFKELGLKEPTTYAEFKDLIKTNDLKYVTTKLINTAAKQLLHSRAYYSQDIVSIENLISGVKSTPGLWEEFRKINRHQKVSLNEFRFLTKDELKKYGTQFNITDSTRTLIYESKTHKRRILISFTYDPNTGGTIPIMERIYD